MTSPHQFASVVYLLPRSRKTSCGAVPHETDFANTMCLAALFPTVQVSSPPGPHGFGRRRSPDVCRAIHGGCRADVRRRMHRRGVAARLFDQPSDNLLILLKFMPMLWCPGEDSNLHAGEGAST